jgi:nucleoside phosphorylase
VKWLTASEMRGSRPWEYYIDQGIARLGILWERPGDQYDRLQDWNEGYPPTPHPDDSQRRVGRPRVFHGAIASANKLLKNPQKRDALRDEFHVKAIEMEGAGIADATWSLDTSYLAVRGTCDYCNPDKGDVWHKYAALISAAYTRAVIEKLAPSSK